MRALPGVQGYGGACRGRSMEASDCRGLPFAPNARRCGFSAEEISPWSPCFFFPLKCVSLQRTNSQSMCKGLERKMSLVGQTKPASSFSTSAARIHVGLCYPMGETAQGRNTPFILSFAGVNGCCLYPSKVASTSQVIKAL